MVASTSAPNLGMDLSSESEHEVEPPSPDIKAFHGDASTQQEELQSPTADDAAPSEAFSAARRSMESGRLSTDSASAMPIGSVAKHRSRRPPLRANSTFASRDGVQRQASVKMVRQLQPLPMHIYNTS